MRRLGNLELHVVSDGEFRLDGGSMFGAVPKVLWERKKVPDERNRIRLGTNCLLIRSEDELVLVDTGVGDKNDDKFHDIYGVDPTARRLPESIERAGFKLTDVTQVVLTHLHFDHCGWNTRFDGSELVPTFPRAKYWLQHGEVAHARNPNERDRASYDPRNWEPLFTSGQVQLFDYEAAPARGVKVVKSPGHNRDHSIVLLDGGDERGVFWADLVPTTAHVPYPWIMGFDLYPIETLENKKLWLPRAAEEGWLCVFEHDAESPLGRLKAEKPGRYGVQPVDEPVTVP